VPEKSDPSTFVGKQVGKVENNLSVNIYLTQCVFLAFTIP
jgi:hypothetical protein